MVRAVSIDPRVKKYAYLSATALAAAMNVRDLRMFNTLPFSPHQILQKQHH